MTLSVLSSGESINRVMRLVVWGGGYVQYEGVLYVPHSGDFALFQC